ncbi:MAG: hypothetical protein P4M08_09090 [Oligoflexia bacterium]|nr:hypothetical protein [Oligoflexia bacterium]
MKKHTLAVVVLSTIGMIAMSSGCSTFGGGHKSSEEIASTGPTILTAKSNPSTIELDQNLEPKQNAYVFADVKDFSSRVQNVHVKFLHVPIDLPMKQVAGTTWEAELTPAQLKELAVSGQTIRYQANIVAMNAKGQTAVGASPLEISIRSPAPDQLSGIAAPQTKKRATGQAGVSGSKSGTTAKAAGTPGENQPSDNSAVEQH